MSGWEKYRTSRTSWGINVLGSIFVEIEASDGTVGFATGFGGVLFCFLSQQFHVCLFEADIAYLGDDLVLLKWSQ